MISKPYWLRSWLDNLNWDILVWHVYVGDAIESGIDWAIDHINDALEWGEDAWNKAIDAWWKAVDVYNLLLSRINSEVDKLLDKIDAWWDQLDDWWDATWDDIKDWIAARLQNLKDFDAFLDLQIKKLDTLWDNFRTNTLPNLISFSWFKDWETAIITPIQTDAARHESWFDLLKDLMADPEKWLLDRISSMLARFI